MKHRVRFTLAFTVAIATLTATAAFAHPDHGDGMSYQELFPGEGVEYEKQHGGEDGHLPPRQENVRVVGKAEISDRTAGQVGITGRVADVNAHGNYAYLGAFRDPTCETGATGVHVVDISDPTNPNEVEEAFIPAQPGLYVGEGVQVIQYRNRYFQGDVLIHNNELCATGVIGAPVGGIGGISLWNVTDPRSPSPLAENVGDRTDPASPTRRPFANASHSMFAWQNHRDGRTYVAAIDNVESTDVDILDITNPRQPVLVNDTLDLAAEPFNVGQDQPSNLRSVFSHDMFVKRIGTRYVMSLDYWDGGYVLLDVTNPRAGNVVLIDETDYALLDEERLERGEEITPEGNAHQSEISPRNDFVIGTDEDFNPYRAVATIESGPFAGTEFQAAQASDTPPVTEEVTITGPTTFVGLGCDPLPAGSGVALIERGVCPFQQKLNNIEAAGYEAGIVFNSMNADCLALVTMLAESETTPFVFVNRQVGLQLLGVNVTGQAACTTAAPAAGAPSADVEIRAIFDGWGYVRLFKADLSRGLIPTRPITGTQTQIDTYAIEESQSREYAEGFGDLSVHEVAIDPDPRTNLAYFSYYAGGFRVAEYGDDGLNEVGAFIDEGGNNFWGVQVHELNGQKYVLASDRDYGLYIFQYEPGHNGD